MGPATWLGLGRRPLGRAGEEALEVAQPVATVAARVDPVVAQAAGVAPGANRVRMDAQDMGSSGDAERRVGRSRVNLGDRGHRFSREDM
jgi:hypothetical protein